MRGTVTLMLLIFYDKIELVCEDIFGSEDDVASTMALQYVIVLVIFLVAELLLSLVSLIQGSQSKDEYISNYLYLTDRI